MKEVLGSFIQDQENEQEKEGPNNIKLQQGSPSRLALRAQMIEIGDDLESGWGRKLRSASLTLVYQSMAATI